MLTVVKRMVLIFVAMMLDSTGIAASSFDAHSGRLLADWGTLSAASTRGDRDVAARIVNRMGVAPLASAMLQAAEKGANQKTDAEIESRALAALFGATAVENPLRLAPEMALLLHHPNGLLVAGALASAPWTTFVIVGTVYLLSIPVSIFLQRRARQSGAHTQTTPTS